MDLSMPLTAHVEFNDDEFSDGGARFDDMDSDAAELRCAIERYQEDGLISYHQGNTAGLSDVEAAARFDIVGPNELSEQTASAFHKYLGYFKGPIPNLIWCAVLIEFLVANWAEFSLLCALQLINGTTSFLMERSSGAVMGALREQLAADAVAKRSGSLERVRARTLVPGDVISLRPGNVVPADCKVVATAAAAAAPSPEVDQSILTGEPLPISVGAGDKLLMGTTVLRGELEAMVLWTGRFTFCGRTTELVNSVRGGGGRFGAALLRIVLVLLGVGAALVSVILVLLLVGNHSGEGILTAIEQCVIILVACTPIALQLVSTSTMAAGAHELAKKNVICTRLSAIEDLASLSVLCSAKTRTLTQETLELSDAIVVDAALSGPEELIFHGALASRRGIGSDAQGINAIDRCIVDAARECPAAEFGAAGLALWEELELTPFEPAAKLAQALVVRKGEEHSRAFLLAKAAPQVALRMAHNAEEIAPRISAIVQELADRGLRALCMVRTEPGDATGQKWIFTGVLSLLDPLRCDTEPTVKAAIEMGIEIKMITGDQVAIAKETGARVGMGANILDTRALCSGAGVVPGFNKTLEQLVCDADGFAELYPEHKLQIAEVLVARGTTCGLTGDSVSDVPALKKASIGIAVEGATDAARAAADVVLTDSGLSVIVDALLRSRKIFSRVRNYATYRAAASLQIVITLFIITTCFDVTASWTRFERTIRTPNGPIFDYNSDAPRTETRFTMPVFALVLVVLCIDSCVMTIAKDTAAPSKKPQGWNLKEIFIVASFLASSLVIEGVLMGVGCLATGNLVDGSTIGCGQWGVVTGVSTTQLYCGPNFAVNKATTAPFDSVLSDPCPVGTSDCVVPATKSPTGALLDLGKCLAGNAKNCDPLHVLSRSRLEVSITAAGVPIVLTPLPGGAAVGIEQVHSKLCADDLPVPGIVQATKASNESLFAESPYAHGCSNMMEIFCASPAYQKKCAGMMNGLLGDPERGNVLGYQQFKTAVYMVVALSGLLTIFVTRTRGCFLERRPGAPLAGVSLIFLLLTTVVCASVEKDSNLGMQSIGHALGMIWAYVIVFFLIEDLFVKAACYKIMSLCSINDDSDLIKTMARKEASTAAAESQKQTRTDSAVDGSTVSGTDMPSILSGSSTRSIPDRLQRVETDSKMLQSALLRKRVIDRSDLES
jgi:H+-transporting ATPase